MSLDVNVTYVIVLALFAVALIVLNTVVFGPFMELLNQRYERLEGAVERADEMLKKAEAQAETFADRIKVATTQGLQARSEIRATAQREMNDRLEQEKAKLNGTLSEAMKELSAKREKAMGEIGQRAEQIAEQTAAKLLGRAL